MTKPLHPDAWTLVIFAHDLDEEGNCPVCGTDAATCPCPGPTQEGYVYQTFKGRMYAQKIPVKK